MEDEDEDEEDEDAEEEEDEEEENEEEEDEEEDEENRQSAVFKDAFLRLDMTGIIWPMTPKLIQLEIPRNGYFYDE